jgi:hypothetical protein
MINVRLFAQPAKFLPLLIMFSVALSSHLLFAVAFKHIKERNSGEKELHGQGRWIVSQKPDGETLGQNSGLVEKRGKNARVAAWHTEFLALIQRHLPTIDAAFSAVRLEKVPFPEWLLKPIRCQRMIRTIALPLHSTAMWSQTRKSSGKHRKSRGGYE